ncbi:MAG TPA: glycoside hydrolase family 127 protein [Candidatus Brocadiia bacterium]|nr:glycoside hydrolase family 127 protein [Candidatus Brocadiia bacterium]
MNLPTKLRVAILSVTAIAATIQAQEKDVGKLTFDCAEGARFSLQGPVGERVRANLDNWLLRAPVANPGMIEMFRVRDRKPEPQLVPWAGEFVGKYLISAIQARRMTESPELDATVRRVISDLISCQAEDGYLGPFKKNERLLGQWDLWGHYHWMLALMIWHDETGDAAALKAVTRAADLVCNTYLDTNRRVIDAGSHEMNMAVIHSMARLYRKTGNERYLRMTMEILKDFENAGDYFRTGLAGKDYYRTPRPRWESLHDIQGLVELYLITGDERYRSSYENIWWSINRYDRHNTGGFTTGERAIGDPYAPGAIETCCTTAWTALSVDMLRLTGDSLVADEIERATYNSIMGSQHPSGRWWTYDTPMDGRREASAHTIVFQARFGTPELNCCSVNAPRGLGMISEWGVMSDDEGPIVNYYGPGEMRFTLRDGTKVALAQKTAYPVAGDISLTVTPEKPATFNLRLRIPHWSKDSAARVNGEAISGIAAGTYLSVKREWKKGDLIEISLDMRHRIEPGERACQNKVSVFRGPLLLAFDQHYNKLDTHEIPALDPKALKFEKIESAGQFKPMILEKVRTADGTDITLCDFASAAAYGTHYASWLPAKAAGPAAFYLARPAQGKRIGTGPYRFRWTCLTRAGRGELRHTLMISKSRDMSNPVVKEEVSGVSRVLDGLAPGEYFWTVVRHGGSGDAANYYGPQRFTVDAAIKNDVEPEIVAAEFRADGLGISDEFDGKAAPKVGTLEKATDIAPAKDHAGKQDGAIALNGETSGITYAIPFLPEDDYAMMCRVCPEGMPYGRLGQIFSAWAGGMDDPLRVVIHGDELFARIEAGSFFTTKGVKVENGKWIHVAAVKRGGKLELYVDGKAVQTVDVPAGVYSGCEAVGIGTNPRYTEHNERLKGRLDSFRFYARALSAEEIASGAAK